MADGSIVIGVGLDTAGFAASAAQLETQILSLGTRLNTSLTTALGSVGIGDSMAGVFAGITTAAASLAETLSVHLRTAASSALTSFTGAGWGSAGTSAANDLAGGIRSGGAGITSAIDSIASEARAAFSSGSWSGIGSDMISGVAAGIRAAGAEVISAIREVSQAAESAVKGHFQISSPSVKMRDEVGVMISRGIAEGITGGASFVTSAIDGIYSGTRQRMTASDGGRTVNQTIYLRDSDASPYQTAKRIRRESEVIFRT